MKYAIFGGSGFIGSHITRRLVQDQGQPTEIVSRTPLRTFLSNPNDLNWTFFHEICRTFLPNKMDFFLQVTGHHGLDTPLHLISYDLADYSRRGKLGCIFNECRQAAFVYSVGTSNTNRPLEDYIRDIFQAGLFLRFRPVGAKTILISSTEVYGGCPAGQQELSEESAPNYSAMIADPKSLDALTDFALELIEETTDHKRGLSASVLLLTGAFRQNNFHPRWHYGLSRLVIEGLFQKTGPALIFRVANVFGGRPMQPGKLITTLCRNAEADRPTSIISRRITKSFIHVDDVARAALLALISPVQDGVFNIADPENEVSIYDLARRIYEMMQKDPSLIKVDENSELAESHRFNVSRAERAFGFRPQYPLEQGLTRDLSRTE